MRLIDADDLFEKVKKAGAEALAEYYEKDQDSFNGGICSACTDFGKMILEQPTAYNVDEVVEQLEKLKKEEQDRSDDCDENGCCDSEEIYDDGRSQGRFEAYEKAIGIVKEGGVDGYK